jgi:hypothetical protein
MDKHVPPDTSNSLQRKNSAYTSRGMTVPLNEIDTEEEPHKENCAEPLRSLTPQISFTIPE